ncbi:metal-dependent hydrolase family protein [Desulfospira joergensenii]|uniref:metal-dependent hydrolase family protein n=1 Tax=Desulfospira joergensenii TaxID=53329 RepID=UPI0003B783E4|nr:amidohydrolase family protein [Desulfospira joergensenii]
MKERFIALTGGTLIDGTGAEPLKQSCLLIQNGLVRAAGTLESISIPEDAQTLDCRGKTIMPGLIDAHVHLLGVTSLDTLSWVVDDPCLRTARATMDAWRLLDSGFTTVRDPGTYISLFIRNAVNEGTVPGPRILSAGKVISQTGGHGDPAHHLPDGWVADRNICRIADGEADCRRAVREQARAGADLIKIMTTGGVMSDADSPEHTQYSIAEIRAMTDEAHSMGLKVASHAQGRQGIINALQGGVDTIEHGTGLDSQAIDLMLKTRAFLIPTLSVFHALVHRGERIGIKPHHREKARGLLKVHKSAFIQAWKAGVKIGLGTDFLLTPQVINPVMGNHAEELALYVSAGLSPMDAIVCATRNNAEALGVDDRTGTLVPGKQADLLVLDKDPLVDISRLQSPENIAQIFKGGRPVPRIQKEPGTDLPL